MERNIKTMEKILSQEQLDNLIDNRKDKILKCLIEFSFGEIITFTIKRTNDGIILLIINPLILVKSFFTNYLLYLFQ